MPFQTYCYYIPPMEYMHKHNARRCIVLSAAPDTVQVPVPLADVQASVLPATSTFHNGTSLVFDPFKAFHSTISTHRNTGNSRESLDPQKGSIAATTYYTQAFFPHRNQTNTFNTTSPRAYHQVTSNSPHPCQPGYPRNSPLRQQPSIIRSSQINQSVPHHHTNSHFPIYCKCISTERGPHQYAYR
ncbi:hypothetical protein CI102_4184 [Trichoderma harzianum]|nr:hypothetical protein CI102_4184 [Trichoderma harzianum]